MTTTNRTRIVVIALVIAILALFAYAIYQNTTAQPDYTGENAPINERADAIENYVRANLAELSPVAPSMGGTFYITRIRMLDGTGTVNYEDGHMAYVADFNYTVSENNRNVTVTDFVVRDQ